MNKRAVYILMLVLSLVAFTGNLSYGQCAMCKQAAESTLKNDPTSLARSLNSGILYLMAVPYLMLMFIFRKQIKILLIRVRDKYLIKKAV